MAAQQGIMGVSTESSPSCPEDMKTGAALLKEPFAKQLFPSLSVPEPTFSWSGWLPVLAKAAFIRARDGEGKARERRWQIEREEKGREKHLPSHPHFLAPHLKCADGAGCN